MIPPDLLRMDIAALGIIFLVGLFSYLNDITKRKKAEEELRKS